MKYIATIIMYTGLFMSSVHAQKEVTNSLLNSLPNEHVDIITNSELLLSGQVLYYTLSCSSEQEKIDISKIAYVELISDKKESIIKQKLKLENKSAYGDFFIPASLKTGHYKIVAYTNWSLNNPQQPYDQKNLYIINPYLDAAENGLKNKFGENDSYIEISADSDSLPSIDNQTNGLRITTDKKTYTRRDKVSVDIWNTLKNTDFTTFTVKVRKIEALKVREHNSFKDDEVTSDIPGYLPEMRGELIRGTVLNKKTKLPASSVPVSLSIPGEPSIYKSTMSNDKGVFYFNLFEHHIFNISYFQVLTDRGDDFEISLAPGTFPYYADLTFYPLKINSDLTQYLARNSIYNQIESAYFNLKEDQLKPVSASKLFYGQPDLVYELDEFARFPTIKETFVEVIRGAAMRENSDGYQFLVYDPDFPFNSLYKDVKPLLLMDGVQIQDERFFVNYNPYEIQTVGLTRGIFSIGSEIYNGIIDIRLITPNSLDSLALDIDKVEITSPLAKKEYFKQNYKEATDRIPDFRTQLLWMPEVTWKSEKRTIDFYTSDVPGNYIVELTGINSKGKIITVTDFFEVSR